MRACIRLLAALAAALAMLPAAAQYPGKPIRIVVPFPPGGGVDIVARTVGEKISGRLGQPVVVDNKPGASMTIGTDAVAKSAPDGYTLLLGPIGNQAVVQATFKKLAFDMQRDFAPVTRIGYGTIVLVVPSTLGGARSRSSWPAKAKPGRLTFASSGTGALIHLTGEMFKHAAAIDITHVPYKGTTQILPDLLDGRVDMAVDSLPAYLPHIKSGKLRALGVASRQRSTLMPDIPTIAEAGVPRRLGDRLRVLRPGRHAEG
jgi:tripartite-type tricarboxylate transporter receptor subunit TctC